MNSVARLETSIEPTELLETLQAIEGDAQRVRGERWAARQLDLDLIAYGEEVIRQSGLCVPHPRMSFRPFVLGPAAEVAPEWRHPELRSDLARLLRVFREGAESVRLIGNPTTGSLAAAAVSQLLRLDLPREIDCSLDEADATERCDVTQTPRLTIDLRDDPSRLLGPRGPRLALVDCPRDHWRDEVRAAIDCVWPREASAVF